MHLWCQRSTVCGPSWKADCIATSNWTVAVLLTRLRSGRAAAQSARPLARSGSRCDPTSPLCIDELAALAEILETLGPNFCGTLVTRRMREKHESAKKIPREAINLRLGFSFALWWWWRRRLAFASTVANLPALLMKRIHEIALSVNPLVLFLDAGKWFEPSPRELVRVRRTLSRTMSLQVVETRRFLYL